MEHAAKIASSVMFVAELDRSVEFYRDVFACTVAILDVDAALLLSPGGFQMYLVASGGRAQHALDSIGLHYLIWSVDNAESLQHFEQALRGRGVHTDTHTSGGIDFVSGYDPDGIRIVIAHPGPEKLARSVVSPRIYAW